MSSSELIAENIRKVYTGNGSAVEALRGVNFEVKKGEFVIIAGPSGSGKSTLLNLLGLLDTPTDGRIVIDGVDVSTLRESRRTRLRNEKIGFVFQFFNLMPELNLIENVMLPGLIYGTNKEKLRREAAELLRMIGLDGQMKQGGSQLSGGQMQRAAVARALINQPSIVLADEPTGNLDSKNTEEIIELMRKLNKRNKQTFLIVTHAPEMFGQADKTIFLKDGTIERISS
ncbi:MAG: ABC transporter ATP-binding protein [Thaumarchaeota archaeon]|nr:ABC transporter ATP-binding protein [Nitrososphaerota archaeon]